jgi:hypothetical protein
MADSSIADAVRHQHSVGPAIGAGRINQRRDLRRWRKRRQAMAQHHVVEHRESDSGMGAVLGIVFVLLLVVAALFFALGGPGRFVGSGSGTPNQTNVNVPAQSQPQAQPNINVPRQIDVNVNQQQPNQQAPAPAGNR